MSIIHVEKKDKQLQHIANIVASAKKAIVVTGAGISTNCGIPVSFFLIVYVKGIYQRKNADPPFQDFRSQTGLYKLIKSQHDRRCSQASSSRVLRSSSASPRFQCDPTLAPRKLKGKDFFSSDVWNDPTSTSTFYSFIASLRKKIRDEVEQVAAAHHFIKTLRDCRRLVRCYTQNIDGLETRVGLCADLNRGKGSRGRFARKSMELPRSRANSLPGGVADGGCEIVQLHGDLRSMRCELCRTICEFDRSQESLLLNGMAPECHFCRSKDRGRRDQGKRGTTIGSLRPNIVLYGEEHPSADAIGEITTHDLALFPDMLLILGTSLHVHGLKILVKEFAKAVHSGAGGKVVFVNLTKPSESVWKGIIDYWVAMDCDEWIRSLHEDRPDLWQIQRELDFKVKKNASPTARANKAESPLKIEKMGASNEGKKTNNMTSTITTSTSSTTTTTTTITIAPVAKTKRRNTMVEIQINRQKENTKPMRQNPKVKGPHQYKCPLVENPNAAYAVAAKPLAPPPPPPSLICNRSTKISSRRLLGTTPMPVPSKCQQLPTPPNSSHRSCGSKRSRSSSEDNNNNEKSRTPSKRAKTHPIMICRD